MVRARARGGCEADRGRPACVFMCNEVALEARGLENPDSWLARLAWRGLWAFLARIPVSEIVFLLLAGIHGQDLRPGDSLPSFPGQG